MPARRAVSFWLIPWASIRSHSALGSTVGACAASTLTGASRTCSIRACFFGLRLRRPLATSDMNPRLTPTRSDSSPMLRPSSRALSRMKLLPPFGMHSWRLAQRAGAISTGPPRADSTRTCIDGMVGRRRVTPVARSTFPSAPIRTGRAAFTASGSPVVYVCFCGVGRPWWMSM